VGVNYLLEGRKKWVFLPPHLDGGKDVESERLGMLAPKRVPPVAWDGGQDYNVSAGRRPRQITPCLMDKVQRPLWCTILHH
jgi:hypothetical protein